MKVSLRKALVMMLSSLCLSSVLMANEKSHVFEVVNPDTTISPYTGMTRQHWKDAAHYLLKGAFSYINDLDDPMKFPKQEGKSYPHNEKRVPTEKLEGLCRTLFVAAPLLKEEPDLVINKMNVGEYYRHQIKRLIDPKSPSYIVPRSKNGGPSQNLVEFGALAISLFVVPEVIWEPLTQKEKDKLAHVMLSYGDGPTVDSNWKFFNIFVLSFFKDQGYAVNEALLVKYLNRSLTHYRGDGWYNDSPAYDYYSMWAFQLYGVVWSEVFGNKHYPEIAEKLLANYRDINDSYPYMFSRDGKMLMYGRSISYRMGSISPFPFMGIYGGDDVNLGWLRRISSSTLLQFLQHPDFMKENVPTLGFYGPFEPAVQVYSCRGSVYWMGKAFLGLLVPEGNPFWTAVENEGPWESEFKADDVHQIFHEGSEILLTDYANSGASEIRAWCHEKVKDDWQKFRSTENYNRLAYSSVFHWQADGPNGEVAMNYVIKNAQSKWEAWRLYTFKKYDDGIYYRDVKLETDEAVQMNLADISLANGILRIDRNISNDTVEMRLGHYALPQLNGAIKTVNKRVRGYDVSIIDNGEFQLAMVPILGWDKLDVVVAENLHPLATNSAVINACGTFVPDAKNEYFVTLMLWKKSGEAFTNDELLPLTKLKVSDDRNSVEIKLNNCSTKIVVFE